MPTGPRSAQLRRLPPTLCAATVLSLLATLSPGCATTGNPQHTDTTKAESQRIVDDAETAIRAGNIELALAEFARAIEVNPELTDAHVGMADLYRVEKNYEAAQTKYADAITLEPNNDELWFYNGLMLHLMDRLTEAIQSYLQALTLDADNFRASLNLSSAYYQLDELTPALEYAQRAVRLEPMDGSARFNLAAVYAALDRHQDAVREYQQATELMELTPELLMNLAESLGKVKRYEEMRNTLDQLVKQEPSAAAHERLGYARFKLGDYTGATESFQSALKVEAGYYPALNGLGVCKLNEWKWSQMEGEENRDARQEGIRLLRRSLQINADQPQVVRMLSRYGS